MDNGQGECTFYILQVPRTVQQLTINLTPPELQVYNAVMASAEIARLRVEIQTAAYALKYNHDFFNLLSHNYTTYQPLVNHSK